MSHKIDERNDALENGAKVPMARYIWASEHITGKKVVDGACGLGYGCQLLNDQGRELVGVDSSEEVLEYARNHYPVAKYVKSMIEDFDFKGFSSFVFLETIEHLREPKKFMEKMVVPELVISTTITPEKHLNPYHLHDINTFELMGLVETNYTIEDGFLQFVSPTEKYLTLYAKLK